MQKSRLVGLLLILAAACDGEKLSGPATVEGEVRSLATGQLIDGATVAFGRHTVTTGNGGHFVFTGLPTGAVDLVIRFAGHEDATVHLTLEAGTNTTYVQLRPKGSGQYIDSIKFQPTVTPVIMTGPGSIRIRTILYHGIYQYYVAGQGSDTATISISTAGPVTAAWELGAMGWRAVRATFSEPGTGTVTATWKDKTASITIQALDLRFKDLSYAAGYGCGLAVDDAAWCWGGNFNGPLGFPTLGKCNGGACQYGGNDGNPSPLPVTGGYKFAQIATTGYACAEGFAFGVCGRTCALTAAGEAWCWGEGMGIGPRRVAASVTFKSLTLHPPAGMSGAESCGLATDGKAYCFTSTTTTPIAADLTFKSFAAGTSHSCGIDMSGDAYCWGSNRQANLGIGSADTAAHPGPVKVQTSAKFTAIAVGRFSTCALDTTGVVSCWGYTGTSTTAVCDASNPSCVFLPQAVTGGGTYAAMAHSDIGPEMCALGSGGTVDCWTNPTNAPVQPFAEPMASISVASLNSMGPTMPRWCGVAITGVMYCGSPGQPAKKFP